MAKPPVFMSSGVVREFEYATCPLVRSTVLPTVSLLSELAVYDWKQEWKGKKPPGRIGLRGFRSSTLLDDRVILKEPRTGFKRGSFVGFSRKILDRKFFSERRNHEDFSRDSSIQARTLVHYRREWCLTIPKVVKKAIIEDGDPFLSVMNRKWETDNRFLRSRMKVWFEEPRSKLFPPPNEFSGYFRLENGSLVRGGSYYGDQLSM